MIQRDSQRLKASMLKARQLLENCEVCPRKCHVNRLKGELGFCKTADEIWISSFGPHYGEESPLVGTYGSGTIFLTSCNLGCSYCQNYDVSHQRMGRKISREECADNMLKLQAIGCHNINFVTPTHAAPQLMESLLIAWGNGLKLPIIYNCGGYESLEMLKLLDGYVDIYMPDAKYSDSSVAKELSAASDYFDVLKVALEEMQRQVGVLKLDEHGVATKGLLVRHLVLPNGLAGTKEIAEFIAKEISPDTYINVMDQYYPCWEGVGHPKIGRMITPEEFQSALAIARESGLHNFL